jgi:hypothetical protein
MAVSMLFAAPQDLQGVCVVPVNADRINGA